MPYRNRKSTLSQNVLGMTDLEGRFIFVFAGYEGSAHDGAVLASAQDSGSYPAIPENCYILGDACYGLSRTLLTPYRSTRYHLRDFDADAPPPATRAELFNLRHSKLRNDIERAYGVLKRRFLAMMHGVEGPIEAQRDNVYAACALQNFLQDRQDQYPDPPENDDEPEGQDEHAHLGNDQSGTSAWRDLIACRLWQEYQDALASRGRAGRSEPR